MQGRKKSNGIRQKNPHPTKVVIFRQVATQRRTTGVSHARGVYRRLCVFDDFCLWYESASLRRIWRLEIKNIIKINARIYSLWGLIV